jgi:hypothetical protein
MSLSAFIDKLLHSVQAEYDLNEKAITSGNLKNFEEYRHRIGVQNGFVITQNLIKDLKKRFYYGEDDSDSDNVIGE